MDDDTSADFLKRKSDEIWRRIDSIMITIKKEYTEEEESDEKIESLIPVDDEGKKRGFFLNDDDDQKSTSHKIDFAQSALTNYGEFEERRRRQNYLKSTSSRSLREKEDLAAKNRPRVNIDDLEAKVAANEEAVDRMYGAGKSEDVRSKSMFSNRMSIDPVESSMGALGRFGEFDSKGYDDDEAFQQKLRL